MRPQRGNHRLDGTRCASLGLVVRVGGHVLKREASLLLHACVARMRPQRGNHRLDGTRRAHGSNEALVIIHPLSQHLHNHFWAELRARLHDVRLAVVPLRPQLAAGAGHDHCAADGAARRLLRCNQLRCTLNAEAPVAAAERDATRLVPADTAGVIRPRLRRQLSCRELVGQRIQQLGCARAVRAGAQTGCCEVCQGHHLRCAPAHGSLAQRSRVHGRLLQQGLHPPHVARALRQGAREELQQHDTEAVHVTACAKFRGIHVVGVHVDGGASYSSLHVRGFTQRPHQPKVS